MRVSLEWLSEYVDFELTPEQLAEKLSMAGTEVERMNRLEGGVSGVLIAKVVEVKPHPNADRLQLAVVDDGSTTREVVCGAPNLVPGMVSALAVTGARLPAKPEEELKRAVIRGVESDGMLLSAAELGIGDDQSGIVQIDPDASIGSEISEVLPLDDLVLELEITPNRPDCMSMTGIAREAAALTGQKLLMPEFSLREAGETAGDLLRVELVDTVGCPRYSARVVTGVEIGPSPLWMQRRLVASGMRPINNVVDITNYVLLELGQPLHAFDMDLLKNATIIVRKAERGEPMTTLDGVERSLDENCLVIADSERAVALAGVMGGEDSEVTTGTKNVVIESAFFDPTTIMLASRRLGLRTEASSRFERGTDPEGTVRAADRAAWLMQELASGKVATGVVDEYPEKIVPVTIELRPSRVNRVLGTDIAASKMAGILGDLGADVAQADSLTVKVPTFRPDLEREIDLIEEVARIYGYDFIPSLLASGGGDKAGLSREQLHRARLLDGMVSLGLSEVINYSFMRPGDLDILRVPDEDAMRRPVALLNPVVETGEVMRTTMLPGLLRMAASNLNRGNSDLAVFESGMVFYAQGEGLLPEEVERLGVLLCGGAQSAGWPSDNREVDFFDIKGLIEDIALLADGETDVEFAPVSVGFLASGRSAEVYVGGRLSGLIGQIEPAVAQDFGISCEVYVAEMDTVSLLDSADSPKLYREVGRFPNVKVDIAVVLGVEVEERLVEREIRSCGGELLRTVRLFDVYEGPPIPEGKKSLAYALEFGSVSSTLTDAQAHAEMDMIIEGLRARFDASIRGRDEV